MSEKTCLTCGRFFPTSRVICPDDNDVLVRASAPGPYTGTVLDGRYELGPLIGEGGMSWIYEAIDLGSELEVAIKLLRPYAVSESMLDRFRLEAEAARKIEHPGIVKVFGIEADGELPYLVMERLCGPTVDELRQAAQLSDPRRRTPTHGGRRGHRRRGASAPSDPPRSQADERPRAPRLVGGRRRSRCSTSESRNSSISWRRSSRRPVSSWVRQTTQRRSSSSRAQATRPRMSTASGSCSSRRSPDGDRFEHGTFVSSSTRS